MYLRKMRGKDYVLVLRGVNGAPESVGGSPELGLVLSDIGGGAVGVEVIPFSRLRFPSGRFPDGRGWGLLLGGV